ncbi:hypothetical protein SAMN05880574_12216 [Chryseobacterium sp. RU37D]|uniref:hypothetical protein n=1 Tax=Chryseobacterium sp. RU37D TaxID=1907397 RepID=UPI000955BE19|nr:hypothetical protein [Chryseobacterium sp. RU37D]SIQ71654.1 hypothetical protein SAMN05880574_12216 [Chryseobacterium sp. RU37D]
MKKIPRIGCVCEKPDLSADTDFRSSELGIHHTNGRYAKVSILQCKLCQRIWINYLVEYEHYSRSGRWYRGIVSKKERPEITPKNAIEFLENLEWYLYGGSYFNSTGIFGQGKLNVDSYML